MLYLIPRRLGLDQAYCILCCDLALYENCFVFFSSLVVVAAQHVPCVQHAQHAEIQHQHVSCML